MWILAAAASAVFAGLTAILAKCGSRKTDTNLVTAIRTIVVLVMAWGIVFIVGSYDALFAIDPKSLVFLVLSGLATGASWICYFKALALGDVNKVTPIDKSGTILCVILAMVVFGETNHLCMKIFGILCFSVGTFLMIEKKETEQKTTEKGYLLYAVLSAIFAALTSILAKIGIEGVESNLATAIRTIVVLAMAWGIVLYQGKQKQIKEIDKKELLFILLSGVVTGASWLCYYYALQKGIVSVVVPIDKMSILITVLFSCTLLREKLSKKGIVGLCLITLGTLCLAIWA